MLDCSPDKIAIQSKKYDMDFWQLRTPLTKYALAGVPYGLDNGCFKRFEKRTWLRLLEEARSNPPKFVCLPDIVGDARRTLELFGMFQEQTIGLPRCLVLQDGIGDHSIDWYGLEAVFVGGSDNFKVSQEAMAACKAAKMLGKWVHVGRVNTVQRLKVWMDVADSIDGSGISKYDHMLEELVLFLKNKTPTQGKLALV